MQLTILGASPACPNPGGASSGYLLTAGNQHLLIDCGHAVSSVLQMVLPLGDLGAIIISHMHPDHFLDLFPLAYGLQFSQVGPVPLYLPPSGREEMERVREVLGVSPSTLEAAYQLHEYDPGSPLQVGDFSLSFAPTQHYVPANAIRVQAPGSGALGYSADTAWSPSVLGLLRRASLALIEATFLAYPKRETRHGHLTAALAGEMAHEAGAKELVLTHYWHEVAAQVLEAGRAAFGGPTSLARTGQRYEL